MALVSVIPEALAARRGRLLPFVPVGLGTGIGLWFALPTEPSPQIYFCASVSALLLLALVRTPIAPLAMFLLSILCGFSTCGLRAMSVGTPMLEERYYGPVTGRVREVDRSQAGALRITLDRVWLAEIPEDLVPRRVRLSLQGEQGWHMPVPGDVVMTTAHLAAPEGAVEPGAFDFRQMAYFDGLGAVGYTRAPLLLWEEVAPGDDRIGRLRAHLSAAIRSEIPGDPGAFAAGVLTGDRSGLSVQATQALRDSSLAHLLAISGMNMAFLVGFTFGFLRYGLALVPAVALRVNGKKAAAVVALGVACFYLLLSGANVATERAFIMVAVMLLAVLLDRRALTLRSVAVAGTIILLWQPEALLSPGFQMSFAATVALIAAFGGMSRWLMGRQVPLMVRMVGAAFLASLVGGLATAPYAAAHFNRFTDYGLLANLLTGPVMGLVVMPAGALAALAAPFGLAGVPLWAMEQGCRWILFVAREVAALDGAVTGIPATSGTVLSLLTLGTVFLLLWTGWARWLGLLPVLVGFALWIAAERPLVLISESGLVGVLVPDGRALSATRGDGFTARNWLENDGDLALQTEAAARAGFEAAEGGLMFRFAGRTGLIAGDTVAPGACDRHAIVILTGDLSVEGRCLKLTEALLAQTGTLAVMGAGPSLRVVATRSGSRQWAPPVAAPPLLLPDQ